MDEGDFSFPHGLGGEKQRLANILGLDIWIISEDFLVRYSIGDHFHDGGDGVTGYSIINAESLDDAEKIAQDNPFIASIRVYEIMAM